MGKEMSREAGAADNSEGRAAENAAEAVQTPKKKEKKAVKESVYPAGELAANAGKIFGTRQECVMAALKVGGKQEYTVTEAKEIVGRFLKREVR